jgi:hypothetical protein
MGLGPPAFWDCGFESRRGKDVSLDECCVVRSLRRANNLFRGVLPSVVRLQHDHEALIRGRPLSHKVLLRHGNRNTTVSSGTNFVLKNAVRLPLKQMYLLVGIYQMCLITIT